MTVRLFQTITLGGLVAALAITSCDKPKAVENNAASAKSAVASGAGGKWEDWPQFRGLHNGIASALPQADAAKLALTKLWIAPTDNGFGSFAVADARAFTLVTRDKKETLLALDAKSGKELWTQTLADAKYDGGGDSGERTNKGGDGARSTPAVDDGKVYVIDGTVVVWCFDAKDGKELWKYDALKETGGENIHWESAQSPVIDGDLILLAGGGKGKSLLALNKGTG
ncbi:MAG TPA: PQQ-binding-like beta-propeller repeat protein, partial [Verrucomicrobiaceae bacterium]